MSPDSKLLPLKDKWQGQGTVEAFLADWRLDGECDITKWASQLGAMPFSEARKLFKDYIRQQPEVARQCFFHIGLLVSDLMRLQWCLAAARNPVVAARMYIEDCTLTDQHDLILWQSIINPVTGSPYYTKAILSGEIKRKKGNSEFTLVNEESPIVQNLLSKTEEEIAVLASRFELEKGALDGS